MAVKTFDVPKRSIDNRQLIADSQNIFSLRWYDPDQVQRVFSQLLST